MNDSIDGVGELSSTVQYFCGSRFLKMSEKIEFLSPRLVGIRFEQHSNMLDLMDVGARLDEFRSLRKGWFEGKGVAPSASELDWLADAFDANYSVDLPSPYLFPTAEGGVMAEWTAGPWEISLDIELPERKAYWHALNVQTDHDTDRNLDLRQTSDWKWLCHPW